MLKRIPCKNIPCAMQEWAVAARDAVFALHDVVLAGEERCRAGGEARGLACGGHVFRHMDHLTVCNGLDRARLFPAMALGRYVKHGFLERYVDRQPQYCTLDTTSHTDKDGLCGRSIARSVRRGFATAVVRQAGQEIPPTFRKMADWPCPACMPGRGMGTWTPAGSAARCASPCPRQLPT